MCIRLSKHFLSPIFTEHVVSPYWIAHRSSVRPIMASSPTRRPGPPIYKGFQNTVSQITRVEARSNTSTVTLRVVGGDEKGSPESETVKHGHESYGTRTQK
jgi:hypothetical protein